MKRIRARTLVLVNWKGIFYERYTLDDNVTALEGDNGAGKTTVMIAAYVVMLPDMTRLRFTNVGESDATGGDKGVWGRLGNPNRPSYAVVAFDLGSEQVLAGVHLERKGEPSVELTPFLISELPPDVRFQDALLVRSSGEDLVPELSDLKESVARIGGRIQVFRAAREYFAALFERGITPLRLVADEERTRFNDMLRTSMTGGISRALTSEFRSFLLKEESGLADTLARMRGNLDACRRTRTEVNEAQELEREISSVYEAGHEMFAAALLAARERSAELYRRVEEAKQKRDAALRERDIVMSELSERTDERARVEEQVAKARAELESARSRHERVGAASAILRRIFGLDHELREVAAELETAALALKGADEIKARRTTGRARAEEAYLRAAEGLADLQRGLEELHRRADAHRTVMRRLHEARTALGLQDLAAESAAAHEAATKDSIAALDRQRSELDEAIGSAAAHRIDHTEAMRALTLVLGQDISTGDAHTEARSVLRRLSDLESEGGRVEALNEELERLRTSLERQRAVRARASGLSLHGEPLSSAREVQEALRKAQADVRKLEELARSESSKAEECRRMQQGRQREERELHARAARWRELDTVATRLEAALGGGLRSARGLEAARQVLDEERDNVQRRLEGLQSARAEAKDHARSLEQTGGVFHPDLLAARDIVGGELLAAHFEDVDPAQAGRLQARLGPLAEAIVVDEARQAAGALAGRERKLETIWLVEEGSLHDLVAPATAIAESESHSELADVIVEQDGVVRTTRVPSMPSLGRKARQRLIAELYARADELGERIGSLEAQLVEIASRRRDTALLTSEVATIELGDPASELARIAGVLEALEGELEAHLSAADEARKSGDLLSRRAGKLHDLLADAFLLDEPDLTGKAVELERAWSSAARARAELTRVTGARRILGERIDALRRPALSEAELEAMQGRRNELRDRREQLFLAHDALDYVSRNREALAWTDAQESLSARQEFVPSLKAQHEKAEIEQRLAIEAAQAAEESREKAYGAWRKIDDRRSALEASREQAQRELAAKGVDDPSESAVERARANVEKMKLLVDGLDRAERQLERTIAQLDERLEGREKSLRSAEEHLAREDREWRPAEELWQRLRARAEQNGLLTPAITARLLSEGSGSNDFRSDARSWGRALDERLSGTRSGQEIIEQIRSCLTVREQTTGYDYLQAWEIVRDWLRRRVPAQVAEVDDPLEALERLRYHLRALGERLDDQERKLRGASEDVARGIDVHIRNAQRQVRMLNLELEGVRFGTIRRMRIRLDRDRSMEGVLRALREGSAQQLLFAPAMPVEEALEALFTRYGGRGHTLGHKLLDYREYVDIAVEIQRQASTVWERVNPSRLSTGEAIGVGTALMMVVLTAWERAANLFRARRSLGTLRLLFLDEANRLSQDNLKVLFELCTTLDLQLMIAAPEVARGPGCTTYVLVRRETADGGEKVDVSGRRARAKA